MRRALILVLIAGVHAIASAQNPVIDLKKVRTQFLEANQLSFDVEVYHYQSKNSQPALISEGKMRKSGGNYYSSFRGDKMIVNEKKGTLIIDEQQREMSYLKHPERMGETNQISLPDSLLNDFVYQGVINDLKVYEYIEKDAGSGIRKTKIYINSDYQLKRVTHYYKANTSKVSYDAYKVEIYYKNITTSGVSASYFNLNKYLSFVNNEPKLNKQYSQYTLLN